MWSVFCSLNKPPQGWTKVLAFGPVMVLKPRGRQEVLYGATNGAYGPVPPAPLHPPPPCALAPPGPCPCCYYQMSVQLSEDFHDRTPGWFYCTSKERYEWWHGNSPHAPFQYMPRDGAGPGAGAGPDAVHADAAPDEAASSTDWTHAGDEDKDKVKGKGKDENKPVALPTAVLSPHPASFHAELKRNMQAIGMDVQPGPA